ncbi:unnamed protein product [Tilletia controversa]|nr:unnamed protein product [Tilletia controversa]
MAQSAELLTALYKAPSAKECAVAAEHLTTYINQAGLRTLQSESILNSLLKATRNKKSASEREAAAIGLGAIFTKVAGKNAPSPLGAEPWLIDTLPTLLELQADKEDAVKEAAVSATTALATLFPPEAVPEFLAVLYGVLENSASKWQSKLAVLKLISRIAERASEQVGEQLVGLIPQITNAMHDTKSEISKQAIKTATKVCQLTLENNDLRPFIPDLVGCMARPDSVPECIKKLSGTTFVADVTGPALAVMVPLLARALNERSQTVQRQTVIVVDNLCKLVRDPPSPRGPDEVIAEMYSKIPGAEPMADAPGYYTYPCSARDIRASMAFGGKWYTLPDIDFVGDIASDDLSSCMGAFFGLGTLPTDNLQWIVGGAFLKNTYTIFDAGTGSGDDAKAQVIFAALAPGLNSGTHASDVGADGLATSPGVSRYVAGFFVARVAFLAVVVSGFI